MISIRRFPSVGRWNVAAIVLWAGCLSLSALLASLRAQDVLSLQWSDSDPVTQKVRSKDYRGALDALDQKLRFSHDAQERILLLFRKADIAATYLREFPLAIATYDEIVRVCKSPRNDDAHLARIKKAELLCRRSDYAGAQKVYGEIAKNANEGNAYRKEAEERIRRIQDALITIDHYRRQANDSATAAVWHQATFKIAKAFEDIHNPEAAIGAYEDLIRRAPGCEYAAEAQLQIGKLHLELRDTDAALAALQEVVAAYPASRFDAEALFQIGRIYYSLNDYESSLAAFEDILLDYPLYWKLPAASYWRAVCYERAGRIEEAIDAYRLFQNTAILTGEPLAMSDIGKYDKDSATFEAELDAKIRTLEATYPGTLLKRAQDAMKESRYAAALSDLRKLVIRYRMTPQGENAAKLLTTCAANVEIQRALNVAETSSDPVARARARFQAATYYETNLKDYDRALELYQQVANEKEEVAETWKARALFRVGSLYIVNLDNINRGLQVFQQLTSSLPDSSETANAYFQIGEIYRQQRRQPDEAIRAFQFAIQLPQLSTYLGDGYESSVADAAAFRIVRVYFESLKKEQEAIARLQEFIGSRTHSPRLAAAWLYMSHIHQQMDRSRPANDARLKAAELVTQSPIQGQLIRYEFPELSKMDNKELVQWMRNTAAGAEKAGRKNP